MPPRAEPVTFDGRHARREKTRAAVVEALLDLIMEGDLQPSAERIAERAGVSRRSIFHYFRDMEDLLGEAVSLQASRVIPTLKPPLTEGPLADRARVFAGLLAELYERVAPMRRAALLAEPFSEVAAAALKEARRIQRHGIELAFGPELDGSSDRGALIALLAVTAGFPFWDELRRHQHMSVERATRALAEAFLALASHDPERTKETP